MKKFLSGIAAAALVLGATACGESEKPDKAPESTAAKSSYKIGVSIPAADHGWTGGVVFFAEEAKRKIEAENPNVTVIVSTAKDSSEQVDKIENLMVQKIDALVILPQEPGPLTRICEEVKAKGIKLIVVDRGLEKDIQDLAVVGDNHEFGRVAAETMAKELGGKGDIVVMEGIPCQVNTDRVNAFNEVMKKYPDIKILESNTANWDTVQGLNLMETYLQKYKKIDGVWTGDDDVLIGALKAYAESGRNDVKVFIGGGGSKEIVKRILDKDPVVRLTVTYPPQMIEVAVEKALELLKRKVVVHAEVVNPENASGHYFPNSAY